MNLTIKNNYQNNRCISFRKQPDKKTRSSNNLCSGFDEKYEFLRDSYWETPYDYRYGGDRYNGYYSCPVVTEPKKTEPKIEPVKDPEEIYFDSFIKKGGKVTKEEYEEIKAHHPQVLARAHKYLRSRAITKPVELAELTLVADKYLRDNFQNYRIISIGVSPAPLCEQLANLGHEVIFLPATGINGKTAKKCIDDKEYSPELMCLLEYLSNQGVGDDKTDIIVDYTSCKGTTLKYATKMIKDYFNISEGRIVPLSIQQLIGMGSGDYIFDAKEYLIEDISNVPHFPVSKKLQQELKNKPLYSGIDDITYQDRIVYYDDHKTNEELFEKFENYSLSMARAFSLCTMDELDKARQL